MVGIKSSEQISNYYPIKDNALVLDFVNTLKVNKIKEWTMDISKDNTELVYKTPPDPNIQFEQVLTRFHWDGLFSDCLV